MSPSKEPTITITIPVSEAKAFRQSLRNIHDTISRFDVLCWTILKTREADEPHISDFSYIADH